MKGRKVVEIRTREKLCRNLTEDTMETRNRARAVEELEATERKYRDIKGKALAKEETVEEIYEIYDDSEDEDDLHEQGRRSKERGGTIGGWDTQQTSEEQQGQREEKARQRGRQRGGRGVGNRLDSGSRRGRGPHRNRGERGGRQGQRGRSVKRTSRSLDKKIQQAERAYNQNTNPRIRRIIQNMEEDSLQAQSDSEMEDWEFLLHDPGNTRGRMSLLK